MLVPYSPFRIFLTQRFESGLARSYDVLGTCLFGQGLFPLAKAFVLDVLQTPVRLELDICNLYVDMCDLCMKKCL